MTRNEPEYISVCIDSIIGSTNRPVKVFVVDNKSDDEKHISILKEYENKKLVKVLWCKRNRWILNINEALREIESQIEIFDESYFVVTDGDIVVSKAEFDWLDTLIDTMNKYPFLGKLGGSIDLGLIKDDKFRVEEYQKECNRYENKICPNVYNAQVDTTLAVYRWDASIYNRFRFYPGHMSSIRPYYYVGRHSELIIEHKGWEKAFEISYAYELSKLFCFARYCGKVKKETFEILGWKYKIYYLIVYNISRIYWGLKSLRHWVAYFIRNNFGRKQNKLQKS